MMRIVPLVVLVVMLVGCERYRSRGQGPFANYRRPAVQSPSALPASPPVQGRQPLAINTPPAPKLTAPLSDESLLIPPRPPESGGVAAAPVAPQPPQPPAVPGASGVEPAGGIAAGPDADDRRRILPRRRNPGTPEPKTPAATTPAAAPQSEGQLAELQKLVQIARDKWKSINTYEAKLTRREAVNADPPQTQEVQFLFRKEPMSVYTKNTGSVGRGREILYYPAKHGDKIHVIVGAGDTPFLKAGNRAPAMDPDSRQVRSKSRYSIRDIGFGSSIERFAKYLDGMESGKLPPDALKYLGHVKRTEYGDLPLAAVEQTLRPGDEPQTPKGGVRQWFFDAKRDSPSYGLPVLIIAYENDQPKPREVEYYCFTGFRSPANLTDADFDPARMGK